MEMTIEQIIKYLPAPICGDTVIGEEKQKEYDAHDSAVIILRKYQKIQKIINTWHHDIEAKDFECMAEIADVVEDRNDDFVKEYKHE